MKTSLAITSFRRWPGAACAVALLFARSEARAQSNAQSATGQTNTPGTLLQQADVVPGVSPKTATSPSNAASVALQAAPSGSLFRVAFMPGYLPDNYYEVLSEAKISAATSTATSLTTIALSIGYNPFAMKGVRGNRVWDARVKAADCSTAERFSIDALGAVRPKSDASRWDDDQAKWKHALGDTLKNVPAVFAKEFKTLSDQRAALDAVHVTLAQRQKASDAARANVAAAAKALSNAEHDYRDALIALATAASDDQAARASGVRSKGAARDEAEDALGKSKAALHATRVDETKAQAAVQSGEQTLNASADQFSSDSLTALKQCTNSIRAAFWHDLNQTWIPQITATVGADVYPSGWGPNPLDKTGNTIAPLEPFGGIRSELGLLFRPSERLEFEVFGQYRSVRPSGAPYTHLADYEGGGVTIAWLVWTPLTLANEATNADYQSSGAMPGVALGASGQALNCRGFLNCTNNQLSGESLTPFIDVKVVNAAQFRVSVPLVWTRTAALDTFSATPTFSAATAFAGL